MIDPNHRRLSMNRQCKLVSIARSLQYSQARATLAKPPGCPRKHFPPLPPGGGTRIGTRVEYRGLRTKLGV